MQELCLVLYAIRFIFKLLNTKKYEYKLTHLLNIVIKGEKNPKIYGQRMHVQ